MEGRKMKYALMVRNDDLSKKTALKIKESLQNFFIYDEKNPDLVISIGGDGTILEAVHQYLNVDCCFVGIHTGTLGFYTDYQVDEVDQFIKDVASRQFKTMKRYMLEIKINKKGSEFLRNLNYTNPNLRHSGHCFPYFIRLYGLSYQL